jgi:plastocyanin
VHDICGDSGLRQHPVRQGGRSLSGGNPTSAGMHVATITFTAATPGTYQYLCAVPGHAQRGMLGNFVVTG